MTTPLQQRRLNDANGLLFVYKFGWLRTVELGKLLWPKSSASRQAADRLARSWVQRQLVIVRDLPDGAGRALVLAAAGVRLLAESGIEAGSGKDIGRFNDDGWLPPATWRHDLLGHGVLCELHRVGYHVYPEADLRRQAVSHSKIPDGFAVKGNEGIHLEVEYSRKSGNEMRKLANALSIAASGQSHPIAGIKPTAAMVAYLPSALDERGYVLSHRMRVRHAIQFATATDLTIYWAKCSLLGNAGVGQVEFQKEVIGTDRVSRITRIMEATGWHRHSNGALAATYGQHIGYVWHDEHGWSYAVETINGQSIEANYASNLSDAKRSAASVLALL